MATLGMNYLCCSPDAVSLDGAFYVHLKSELALEKKEPEPIRILVADDHSEVLETVVPMLEAHFTEVGTVTDGWAAVEAEKRLRPGSSRHFDAGDERNRCCEGEAQERLEGCRRLPCGPSRRLGYVVKARLGAGLAFAIKEALEGLFPWGKSNSCWPFTLYLAPPQPNRLQ